MLGGRGALRRLGLIVLLGWAFGCGAEEPLRTRPSGLTAPVPRCEVPADDRGLELPVWDLFVMDPDWDALHADVRADVEVPAQLCIDGELESIGLELQGASGRSRVKKSFKLKFDRDHELARLGFEDDGSGALLDKVYLKAVWIDPSLIREAVAFDLWREMGHDAPRTGFANLRINGDYWGLYTVVEPVDKDYLKRNGYPRGGSLFKATRKHGSRADFAPGRDLERAFEYKSDGDEADARVELEHLVATLQHTELDDAAFERDVDPMFSLDDYIDRMIWVAYTRNGDAVAQNFYLYGVPSGERTLWHQIPWDSDLCLGSNWRGHETIVAPDVSLLLDGGNHLGRRLTMLPRWRARYVERFHQVLDELLTESVVAGYVERRMARVRHDLAEDQLRWERTVSPDETFDIIRDFVAQRPAALREGLAAMSDAPTTASVPLGSEDGPED